MFMMEKNKLANCEWIFPPNPLMCACLLGRFSCILLFATLWAIAHQDPLSMGFSRQQY